MTFRGPATWRELDSVRHAFPPVRGRYAPVAGGRWFVRRWEDSRSDRDGKVWHAWTNGQANRYNNRFKTHAEAITWAQRVAGTYSFNRSEDALFTLYHEKHPERRVRREPTTLVRSK